jgi:predicted transcriptional regulator
MSERTDRRTNVALRQRIDHLLARVRESRDEIVERGLNAVHAGKHGDTAHARQRERAPATPRAPRRRTR